MRQYRILCALVLIYWAALDLLRPVVAIFLAAKGISPGIIGLIVAAQSFVSLFLAIPVGKLADRRVGYRGLLSAGSLGMMGAGALYVISTVSYSYVILVVAQMLVGICELLIWTCAQAFVTQINNGHDSDLNIGRFSFFMTLGRMLGPAIGGFAVQNLGYGAVYVIFIGMSLGVLALSLALPAGRSRPERRESQALLLTCRDMCTKVEIRLGLIGTFVNLFLTGMCTSFYPIYLTRIGVSQAATGLLVAARSLAALMVSPLSALAASRFGRRDALLAATAAAIVAMLVTPLVRSIIPLAFIALLCGAGLGLSTPLTISMIAHNTETEERGTAMGLRLVVNRAGLLANPLIFGFVSQYSSLETSFYVCSAIAGMCVIVAAWHSNGKP